MKKHIVAFLLCCTSINSAQARYSDRFFVTAEIGSIYMEKVLQRYADGTQMNLNSDKNIVAGLGVGYYFLDHLRGDITYQHFADNKLEIKNSKQVIDTEMKTELQTVTFNVMADILPVGPFKLIGGAGLGVAIVHSKLIFTDREIANFEVRTYKGKQKVNLSYALTAGLSFDDSEDLTLEAKYSYRNFQKTAPFKRAGSTTAFAPKELRGHVITAGFRMDI